MHVHYGYQDKQWPVFKGVKWKFASVIVLVKMVIAEVQTTEQVIF